MMSGQKYDWTRGFTVDFSLRDGISKKAVSTRRMLSQMKGMFYDEKAYTKTLDAGDSLVYEFYESDPPQDTANLAFGTSITYPGLVGDEYFMTKGHFHTILATAEIYYTLSGEGGLLIENPEGDMRFLRMFPGETVYVPPRYAHRTVNTGNTPLVSFFTFRADAGHDYGSIEQKGFRTLVLADSEGKPRLVDNPKWSTRP